MRLFPQPEFLTGLTTILLFACVTACLSGAGRDPPPDAAPTGHAPAFLRPFR